MNKQRGVSLISLLIGLLISSIVLVGMMMVFRNTIQTVVPASESSRSDGERVSALLSAHMLLQDAGFGISSAEYDTHLRVLNNNTLLPLAMDNGSTATGNTVVWLSKRAGNTQCNGLRADSNGGLWQVSCSVTMSDITNTTRLILPSRYVGDDVVPIKIVATRTSCWPFGVEIEGDIKVTLVIQNSTKHVVNSSTCLVNFYE